MKKIIACISLVFAMSAGVTALAADNAEHVDSNNSVKVNTDATYNTVLIADPNGKTVYINQNDTTGFGAASSFLLKGSAATTYGDYTVKMGSASGATTTMSFKIKDLDAAPEPIEMEQIYTYDTKDGKYDAGFFHEGSLEEYNTLVFTAKKTVDGVVKTGTAIFDLQTTFSGEGDTRFAVRVVDIPKDVDVTLGVTAVEEE